MSDTLFVERRDSSVREIIRLLRPHQWIKNSFVFTGYLFAKGWSNNELTLSLIIAVCAFSLVASGVYIINDLRDLERDKEHPEKRLRPLPAGTISFWGAIFCAIVVLPIGIGLGYWVSTKILYFLLSYVVINILYTYWLKRIVILDVFVLASGFILRILAGTLGVGIPPSKWLLLCGIMLALFLGFGKRQAELLVARSPDQSGREVLTQYSNKVLNSILTALSASVLVTYALYTVDQVTVHRHHTEALIYTVPIVAYGLFRYLHLIYYHEIGQDPSRDMFKDIHLVGTVLVWLFSVVLILG
jgi:4-hydroxybenzoate polyprenyltransferase